MARANQRALHQAQDEVLTVTLKGATTGDNEAKKAAFKAIHVKLEKSFGYEPG